MIEYIKRWGKFLLLTNKSFRTFRWFGVHVTPVHFYSPVPDLDELELRPEIWEKESELVGINMNDSVQLQFMEDILSKYLPECNFPHQITTRPYEYHTNNVYFDYISAVAMHSIVRHYQPKKIVEVGAGNSTYVIANAARINADDGHLTQVIAIDPYPNKTLQGGFPGLSQLIPDKIQDIDLDLIKNLQANDILSIDTSHVIRTGGDVTFLYLEVLPRLAPGVLIHIHDIFLPQEYPKRWLRQRYFWNEQYLLQAFLICNTDFEVLWVQKYAELHFPDEFKGIFAARGDKAMEYNSCSFWMRRCSPIMPNSPY